MKKRLLILVGFFAMVLPQLAFAAGRPGPYFSGFIGVNKTQNVTMETTDYYYSPATTYNDQLEFDPGLYVGGNLGYDYGLVRLEAEVSYRNANINRVNSDSADRNLDMVAVMGNCFFDFQNSSPVTPYVGGGFGYVNLKFDKEYHDKASGDPVFYDDSASTYAYQIGGGLEVAVNPRFSIDLGYRFFKTGTATFDQNWDLENRLKAENHSFSVGFRAKF